MASYYHETTWGQWNDTSATTATTFTTTADNRDTSTWTQWVVTTDSTSTVAFDSNDATWYTWNEGDTITSSGTITVREPVEPEHDYTNDQIVWHSWIEKHEVIQQRRAETAQRQINAISHEDKRNEAEATAKELLLDLIGPDELKVYEETGRLFVKGRKFDYIVQKDGFVKQVKKDKIVDLCIHLKDKYKLPQTDNVIALKMAIEGSEKEVLKMANKHGTQRRRSLPRAACM